MFQKFQKMRVENRDSTIRGLIIEMCQTIRKPEGSPLDSSSVSHLRSFAPLLRRDETTLGELSRAEHIPGGTRCVAVREWRPRRSQPKLRAFWYFFYHLHIIK